MRHHRRPSLLVLRGRPLRLPRKLSEADRLTLLQFAHRIREMQREVDRLTRERAALVSQALLRNATDTMLRDLQQLYRDHAWAIQGLRSREVAGFDADAKQELIKMVHIIAEEYKDVRHLRAAVGTLAADVQHLTREVSQLRVRGVGEDL
jgi:DNA anti-recombination protein RmuC